MLPTEALAALDRLPAKEALRRPLASDRSRERRVASLLSGDDKEAASLTVGDALFRWARVEPEGFAEADVCNLRQMSELVGAAGRIPSRFGVLAEARRSAAAVGVMSLDDVQTDSSGPVLATARNYVMQRLLTHLFNAQGCEAAVCGAEADPAAIFLNGLQAVVHDPNERVPTKIDRLTFFTQDMVDKLGNLQFSPLVYPLMGLDAVGLNGLLPGADVVGTVLNEATEVCYYANAVAQAGRILLQRDVSALANIASLASSSIAGHVGHVAGKAAAAAALGLTGSWLVVLAPVVAGFTGRVVAKTLVRRARYHLLCRREVGVLGDAIRQHCIASRDSIEANIGIAEADAKRFREMHATAIGPVKDCIEDWLERAHHLNDFRRVSADRFHRAVTNPGVLDPHGGDPIAAAHESLLAGGRVGLHPANVATTAEGVVAAVKSLQHKMRLVIV